MSIRVLLREYPHRSIALVTPTSALIFRHSPSTSDTISNGSLTSAQSVQPRTSTDSTGAARCMVEFVDISTADLSDYRTLSPLPVHGTLGLITIDNHIFICVIESCHRVATVRPGETVERIGAVQFYCLNSSDYDNIFSDNLDPYSTEGQDYGGQSLSRREPLLEHPCSELRKLLGNGSFYYSTDFDLTNRLQDRSTDASTADIVDLDESFLWNSYMIGPLVKFRSRLVAHEGKALDNSRILTSAIRGFVLTITIPSSSAPLRTTRTGLPSSLTLISRLSCRRAGTRFNSRGIDDDGNVANFVESETVYWSPSVVGQSDPATNERPSGICFSYVQIRGSVPVFWEQAAGLIPGQQKISITRSAEGTQPAFDKHFGELEQNYGSVHVVNLLSEVKPGEAELTNLYRYGVRHSALNHPGEKGSKDHDLLRETEFDFHAETKGPNGYEAASMIRRLIENSADGFAYYLSEEMEDPVEETIQEKPRHRTVVVLQQEGIFRTNCLDCLDRTNLIQTIISQMAVESFLGHRGERAASDFWMRHSSLWADNGDALSRIYAGTGALKSSFTRHGKMSLAGAIADARKSATRLYINNFADKGRQNTIDVLLGRMVGQPPVHLFDPINDFVTAELAKRSAEYQSSEVINIWAGTFNLNGRTSGIDEDLSSWLCPELQSSKQQPEIVTVGFQEIVELSPQQIMNSDPTRKQEWERAVRKTLNHHARAVGSENYVLLRSGQLVGAALCIFVKASVLRKIKNVEGSVKKTGMSGMAGNKGAVAIRMDYANTQICFVTAHLAAGFANYEERNRDYSTIHHGLRFQRNRGIDDHDTVIWMGDFNYRIGLGSEKVRHLIKNGDLESLYENDQLNLQMVAGLTFPYYSESRITFNPTYKYDLGNDQYDTSEKARIPAWTDRILRKGTNLRQINYNTAPLRFSDHRPVYATFQCTVSIVNEAIRESLSREIYEKRRLEVGSTTANTHGDDTDDEDLIGYDPIEPGLPPASSDRGKWWLDNGNPAKSTIKPPQNGLIPNPNRPSNPYTPTEEPDWVTVPRMGSQNKVNTKFDPPPVNPRPTTNGTRKLPPPFDPTGSSSVTLANNFSQTSLKDAPPASRLASHQSSDRRHSSSTTSSISKKIPPPIGRKPVHLTSSPSSTSSPTLSTVNGFATIARAETPPVQPPRPTTIDTKFPPPPRRATGPGNALGASYGRRDIVDRREAGNPPTPPQPRRGAASKAVNGLEGPYTDDNSPRPNLPPRRPTEDLLAGDGEEMGMSDWKVLKPN
ncbi:Inositol-1,4,5-trisphosphate 5-phosphatase 1 [Lachnellula cervina]|uniref:phosphoinositide 5-phosphatase n=1 Tax=Lachnellula cervina TaxID=1316786 RepID=A0A7D8YIN8_9HELO|nr:Inositol-1,4,5-trisphosphate 5-phosphatase 1 [Lachnellula cervina]